MNDEDRRDLRRSNPEGAEMNEQELADWQYDNQEALDAQMEDDEIVPAEIDLHRTTAPQNCP